VTLFEFAVPPMIGHVNAALPIAAELAHRGHRVRIRLPAAFAAQARGAGAEFLPYEPPWQPSPADDPARRYAEIPLRQARDAIALLPGVLDSLAVEPYDVLVYDPLCVWGRVLAERGTAPSALLCTTLAANGMVSHLTSADGPRFRQTEDAFDEAMSTLARDMTVPAWNIVDLLHHAEDSTLVLVPPSFQPARETFDSRYHFVGPCLPEPELGTAAPSFADRAGARLYAALGTIFQGWAGFLPLCYSAFRNAEWNVLVASGRETWPAGAPENVEVRRWVDQRRVLREADVFVTHGGMGSVMQAASSGVPMVVIPQTPEQRASARQVAALGLGLRLERDATTSVTLRQAVATVLGDRGFAARSHAYRAEVVAVGGRSAAADILERIVVLDGGSPTFRLAARVVQEVEKRFPPGR